MPLARPQLLTVVAIVLLLIGTQALRTREASSARSAGLAPGLSAAQRAGTLAFAPSTNPADQRVVLDIIARARPEARRLIDLVDGAVTVTIGPTGDPNAIGRAQGTAAGFAVTLDLGFVSRHGGARGMTQVTLHELGHVVDHLLVPAALAQQLDAGIPAGYPCAATDLAAACEGRSAREERFAETFMKWASGDLGVGVNAGGYSVTPPPSLEAWGAPLAGLRLPG